MMVEVVKGTSGQWWQLKYKGQVDYLPADECGPDGPNDSQKRLFRESIDAAQRRAEVEASLPRPPDGYANGGVQRC